jgi:hypothetical protein
MLRRLTVAGMLLTLLAAGICWLIVMRQQGPSTTAEFPPPTGPEPDPRQTYHGPFKNVAPHVKFIGDDRCASCHDNIAETYRLHPMGRTIAPIDQVHDEVKFKAIVEKFQSRLSLERDGKDFVYRQSRLDGEGKTIWEFTLPVQYVIGAGSLGKSYLSDRGGALFQTPLSWYTRKKVWDLAPNFPRQMVSGRPVAADCLFCHANRVDDLHGTKNQFKEPIFSHGASVGCERCHGPGELHARNSGFGQVPVQSTEHTLADPRRPRKADFTIVNPRHLRPALRDAVCQQCHLEGELRFVRRGRGVFDFRPGLPLESCWSVFVFTDDGNGREPLVNQFEQMYVSKCYLQSRGADKLGCISCHDPHDKPSEDRRVSWFRGRCLQCHHDSSDTERGKEMACTVKPAARRKKNPQDSCIDCHMPPFKFRDLPHGALTDHRIVRSDKAPLASPPRREEPALPVVHFHKGELDRRDKGFARDWGLVMVALIHRHDLDDSHAEQAAELLQESVRDDPRDAEAGQALGKALEIQELFGESLQAYQAILKRQPRHEGALVGAAETTWKLNRLGESTAYWRRLIAVNSWLPYYHSCLAKVLVLQGRWADAVEPCGKWRELEPDNVEARRLWIGCMRNNDNLAAARDELTILRQMLPDQADNLDRWFERISGGPVP